MRFSILINCHNQSNYIEECILSSLNQAYGDFEVIVIDSSDIKLNLEKFKSHKNFKYFHIEKFSYFTKVILLALILMLFLKKFLKNMNIHLLM